MSNKNQLKNVFIQELDKLIQFNDSILVEKNDVIKNGLTTLQINDIMNFYPQYIKTIPLDRLSFIMNSIEPNRKKPFSFIMNLSPSHESGSHWVAIYINPLSSIEYYDSFGKEPPKEFLSQLKPLIDKINPPIYLQFKVNRIIEQRTNTTTCGFHCIKFLLGRYNGKTFKECTFFDESSESKAQELANKYQEFGYI